MNGDKFDSLTTERISPTLRFYMFLQNLFKGDFD